MKKLVVSLLFGTLLFAKGMIFSNFNKAVEYGRSSNKPIAVFIVSSSCIHCKELLLNMRKDKELLNFLGNNFAWVVIDVTRQKVPPIIPFSNSTPFIAVLNPNTLETLTDPIKGAVPNNLLYKYLSEVLKLYYNSIPYQSQNFQGTFQ